MALALLHLLQRAQRKASKLRGLCQDFETTKAWSQKDILATYIAIENANLWATFVRKLFLACALGSPFTGKGVAVSYAGAKFASERDALLFAIRAVNSRYAAKLAATGQKIVPRDEPAWHDRNAFLRIIHTLGLSNEPSIAAAITSSATTLEHMPTIRNFYAHRTEETAKKTSRVQLSYGFSSSIHPTEFLASRIISRPQTVLRQLVDDVSVSITIACF